MEVRHDEVVIVIIVYGRDHTNEIASIRTALTEDFRKERVVNVSVAAP